MAKPSLEVIIHKFILKFKIKRNDWLIADTCLQAINHSALLVHKQPIIAFYFEFETVCGMYALKYTLKVTSCSVWWPIFTQIIFIHLAKKYQNRKLIQCFGIFFV